MFACSGDHECQGKISWKFFPTVGDIHTQFWQSLLLNISYVAFVEEVIQLLSWEVCKNLCMKWYTAGGTPCIKTCCPLPHAISPCSLPNLLSLFSCLVQKSPPKSLSKWYTADTLLNHVLCAAHVPTNFSLLKLFDKLSSDQGYYCATSLFCFCWRDSWLNYICAEVLIIIIYFFLSQDWFRFV